MLSLNNGGQFPDGQFIFIPKQKLRSSKSCMRIHNRCSNHKRHEDIQPRPSEIQSHSSHQANPNQHHTIVHSMIKDNNRLCQGEIHDYSEYRDDQKCYHRNRMVQQAEEEDEQGDVHPKVIAWNLV